MDEKETIPEAPSAAISEKGDSADNEKPSSESVLEISAAENFGNKPETNVTHSETDPELQNHVDHKVSVDRPSSTEKDGDHNVSVDEPTSSAKGLNDCTDITNFDDQPGVKKIGKSCNSITCLYPKPHVNPLAKI